MRRAQRGGPVRYEASATSCTQYCRAEVSFHLQDYWTANTSWRRLKAQFREDHMKKLDEFLRSELTRGFYPEPGKIFEAFATTRLGRGPVERVRHWLRGRAARQEFRLRWALGA